MPKDYILQIDDFNKMRRFTKCPLETVKRKHLLKWENMLYNTHMSGESCSLWQVFRSTSEIEDI